MDDEGRGGGELGRVATFCGTAKGSSLLSFTPFFSRVALEKER